MSRVPKLPFLLACCALLIFPCARCVFAQASTVTALMVSDIHFEPFSDPAKAPQLLAAPATQWSAILASPDTSNRAQRFAELQSACHAKGTDTSYELFSSSLDAMRIHAAGVRFITVSGDLMAHDFSCKFHTLFPHATDAAYGDFAAKTVAFVETELHNSFPHAALFTALGNNDSDCGDYHLDANGAFLQHVGAIIAPHLGVPGVEQSQVLNTFAAGGEYDVPMPAPFEHARFIVLDNLFMSKKYAACSGAASEKPAADQIAWLRDQLESARRDHRKVWVMAHIPTGVDPYSTARKMRNVCGGEKPEMFLASDALTDTLADFGDVIRLAIFAHTHMDELRLLEPPAGVSAAHPAVAVKMISSISPVDGNNPSFTVARVNASTAELVDYKVYAASNKTGVDTTWSKEYDFDDAYHEPAFTASTLADLISNFSADRGAQTAASQSYLRDYFVGDESKLLRPFWPQYVCALAHATPESYRSCVCPGSN